MPGARSNRNVEPEGTDDLSTRVRPRYTLRWATGSAARPAQGVARPVATPGFATAAVALEGTSATEPTPRRTAKNANKCRMPR
jgi:hypothetical protein